MTVLQAANAEKAEPTSGNLTPGDPDTGKPEVEDFRNDVA